MSTELTAAVAGAAKLSLGSATMGVITATIANGGTTTAAIDLGGRKLSSITTPAAFTGTAIAVHASDTFDGTYAVITTEDGAVSITVAAAGVYALDDELFKRYRFIKLVSNAAEGAARTLKLTTLPSGV